MSWPRPLTPTSPAAADTWVSVSLTYQGLGALGVPQDSLDSFAWEFQQGMAARAKALGDVGESQPREVGTAPRDATTSTSS